MQKKLQTDDKYAISLVTFDFFKWFIDVFTTENTYLFKSLIVVENDTVFLQTNMLLIPKICVFSIDS